MTSMMRAWLVMRALYELARYDILRSVFRVHGIAQQLPKSSVRAARASGACDAAIADAVLLATCLYWKPVLCLQRSVCLVRLLRAHGVSARFVIGYRPVPFLSHAWVEVDGRVVNDSPAYQQRLRVLHIA
jgi:hypothetical protein